MKLSEATERQRKIARLIVEDGYDIGKLINEGLSEDEARQIANEVEKQLFESEVEQVTDLLGK